MLAGSEYEAHYLTLNHQLTLSIWLVEPGLNPEASGDDLKVNNRLALRRGVSLAQQVTREIPCTRQLFVNINPMISMSITTLGTSASSRCTPCS